MVGNYGWYSKWGAANPNANAKPEPYPNQGMREPSGTSSAEGTLGKLCVGSKPQIGAAGVDIDKNIFLGELRVLGIVSPCENRRIGVHSQIKSQTMVSYHLEAPIARGHSYSHPKVW